MTLGGTEFDLDDLSQAEQRAYREIREVLRRDPEPGWGGEFAQFWTRKLIDVYGGEVQSVETSLWVICQDLEARLGIKQGYVRPPKGDWLWEVLGIADKGKLIFVFYALGQSEKLLGILEDRAQTYIYLLNALKVLSLRSYHFRHRPEPYSDSLNVDFEDLIAMGYLKEGDSGICIGEIGVSWVKKHIPIASCQQLVLEIMSKIEELAALSDLDLFQAFFQMAIAA